MKPSVKKVFKDFSANLSRSVMIILSIAVGLFAIGVIMTTWLCIASDLREGYEATNPANIYISMSDFDNSLVRDTQRNPDVLNASGSKVVFLRAQPPGGDLHEIKLQALQDGVHTINQVEVLEGSWPLKKGEIALENFKFDRFGLKIGDTLLIKTANDKLVPFTIAARVRDQGVGVQEYSQVFMSPVNGYLNSASLSLIEQNDSWNLLKIVVNGDGNDDDYINSISQSVKSQLEKAGFRIYSITLAKGSVHPLSDYVNAIAGTLLIIGLLILFLSGTLIYNTLSAILTQQIRQIGAMKTIGAFYSQLVKMYMRLIFIYSLIALAIAIPTSMAGANLFRNFLAANLDHRLMRTGIIWETIGVQVALGLIVPQLAGAIPVTKGARISIQQALSKVQGSRKGKRSSQNGMISGWTRFLPRPTGLSIRNAFSNRTRLALTLITLSIGGGIFIGSFNVSKMINNHVKSMSNYFRADLSVSLAEAYRSDQVIEEISAFPGVTSVEGWGSGSALVKLKDTGDGPTVSIVAPPEDTTLVIPKMKEGRWLQSDESRVIVLSEKFLFTYPDMKVGDTITLDVNKIGNDTDWTIIGFFSMAGKSGGYLGYVPLSAWKAVSGTATRLSRYEICLDDTVSPDQHKSFSESLETYLARKGFDVTSIQENDTFISDSAAGLNILSTFLFIIALLVAIVGCIGMTGTMSLNVIERTQEIGILRSIGASDHAIFENVLTEGILIGVLNWIGGIILSFPIMKFLSDAMGFAVFGSTMEFAFSWKGYVFWLVISIFFAIVASVLPAKSAIRLTIREVLSVE